MQNSKDERFPKRMRKKICTANIHSKSLDCDGSAEAVGFKIQSVNLINVLYDYYKSNFLTDIVLQCGESTTKQVHKIVLSASSNYFKDLFGQDSSIQIVDMSFLATNVLDLVLDVVYGKHIAITEGIVLSLLDASNHLSIPLLRKSCMSYIVSTLTPDNCLRILSCIYHYKINGECTNFVHYILNFVIENIKEISKSKDFLNMSFEYLEKIISGCTDPIVLNEVIPSALFTWLTKDIANRRNYLDRALQIMKIDTRHVSEQTSAVFSCYQEVFPDSPKLKAFTYSLPYEKISIVAIEEFQNISKKMLSFSVVFGEKYVTSIDKQGNQTIDRYIVGGNSSGIYSFNEENRNLVYMSLHDLDTLRWEKLQVPNNMPRRFIALSVVEGDLFVIGMIKESSIFLRFNHDVKKWDTISNLNNSHAPTPLIIEFGIGFGTSVVYKSLYVIGGAISKPHGMETKGSIYRYNTITNTWTTFPPMNFNRSFPGVGVYQSCIYVFGGFDGLNTLNVVECFDTKTLEWTRCADMNTRRCKTSVAVIGGFIFVLGGQINGLYSDIVERYNPLTDTWTIMKDMVSSCSTLQVILSEQRNRTLV